MLEGRNGFKDEGEKQKEDKVLSICTLNDFKIKTERCQWKLYLNIYEHVEFVYTFVSAMRCVRF